MRPAWVSGPGEPDGAALPDGAADALAASDGTSLADALAEDEPLGVGEGSASPFPPKRTNGHDGGQESEQRDADDHRPRGLSAASRLRPSLARRRVDVLGHATGFPSRGTQIGGNRNVPKEPRDLLMQSPDPRTPPGQELLYESRLAAPRGFLHDFVVPLTGYQQCIHTGSRIPLGQHAPTAGRPR